MLSTNLNTIAILFFISICKNDEKGLHNTYAMQACPKCAFGQIEERVMFYQSGNNWLTTYAKIATT